MTTTTRLGHCTPTLGGHSPACDRDGRYCALASTHSGPCLPHGVRSERPTTIMITRGIMLTRGQIQALLDMQAGWEPDSCYLEHDHATGACIGWSPAEIDDLTTALDVLTDSIR